MAKTKNNLFLAILLLVLAVIVICLKNAEAKEVRYIYDPGTLKATDSRLELKVGGAAPDFILPSISGDKIRLSDFRTKKNVVISFVPAAWTPVCSGQWPAYNIAESYFERTDAVLIGITADNIPTLSAWTTEMGGMWFPVLSDFWPHGAVAQKYGVLRTDGTTERALFLIDKKGIIRYIDVHDINAMPWFEDLYAEMKELQ